MKFALYSRLASGVRAGYIACLSAIAVGLLSGPPVAHTQSIFADLSGTVTDTSGAVIPDARVSVENAATKVIRRYVTNTSGFFSATQLPSGTYKVTAEARGFKAWQGTGIVLNSADDKTLSIPLKPGAETETVEVSASASEIAVTDTGEKVVRIDSEQLNKLSLVGRNATEFLKILPGAAQITNGGTNRPGYTGEMVGINGSVGGSVGGLSGVSVNGQSGAGVSINQDGQNVEDPGAVGSATPINPNPDMIGEVTVQTSNFGADNVKGPVVINTVSKSGSTDFHGDFRLHARNSDLDAEEANSKYNESNPANGFSKGQLKTPSHFYYPGFGIGGPIIIPGTNFNKSRTKFQFHESYEYYDQLVASSNLDRAFVPNADMLNGDFSALGGWQSSFEKTGRPYVTTVPTAYTGSSSNVAAAYNVRTAAGCSISGGVLAQACILPWAQQLLKLDAPAPTSPGGVPNSFGFNYIRGINAKQSSWQNVAHGDVNFSDSTKAYVNWSHQSEGAEQPDGLWGNVGDWYTPVPGGEISKNKSDLYTANLLHIFSPSLTVEGRFGYTHMDMPGAPQRPNQVMRSSLQLPQKGVYGSPLAPRLSNGWAGFGIPNLGDWFSYYHPNFYAEKAIWSTGGDVTKVYKTHTAKAGFFWERLWNAQDSNGMQFGGVYNYSPSPWGNNSVTGNSYADILMGTGFENYTEAPFPPTYKNYESIYSFYVTDHWKMTRRITVDYGSRFDHYTPGTPDTPYGNAVWVPGQYQAGVNNAGISWHGINSGLSKAGVSADLVKFSPRFGAAIDVYGNGRTVLRGGWGIYLYQVPVLNGTGPAGVPFGASNWTCGNGSGCLVWEDIDKHVNDGSGGCAAGSNCAAVANFALRPTLNNSGGFNLVDSKNRDNPQTTTYSLNLDQQFPGKLMFELSYVGSHSDYGQQSVVLNAVPLGAMSDQAAVLSKCTNYTEYSNAIGQADCQQKFRPFPNYRDFKAQESAQASQYDALQVSLQRSAGWSVINLNYSWAKNLGNPAYSGAFKDFGKREYWSVLNIDRAHVFNAAYVLSLPKIGSGNRLLRGAANGWQFSGITQVQSGAQVTAASSYTFNIQNAPGGSGLVGSPDVTVYPVITCDPKSGLHPHQFANPDCFSFPTGASYGNGRIPYIPGPLYWNSDATIMKNFSIKENQNLEVRFAAFDFLNHDLLSFGSGDNNLKLNFDSSGKLQNANDTSDACPGPFCQAFGYADYHYGHRILEFGAKYSF